MRRVDQQYLLQIFDLIDLSPCFQMGKYVSEDDLIDKYAFAGFRFQFFPSFPEIVEYLAGKYIDLSFITEPGKPNHRGEHLLIIGRNKFFQSLRGFVGRGKDSLAYRMDKKVLNFPQMR